MYLVHREAKSEDNLKRDQYLNAGVTFSNLRLALCVHCIIDVLLLFLVT